MRPAAIPCSRIQWGLQADASVASLEDLRDDLDESGNGEPEAVYSVEYERDRLGRITQKTEAIGGGDSVYEYNYDAAGRLVHRMVREGPKWILPTVDMLSIVGAVWSLLAQRSGQESLTMISIFIVSCYWFLGRWSLLAYSRSKRLLAGASSFSTRLEAYFLRGLILVAVILAIGVVLVMIQVR